MAIENVDLKLFEIIYAANPDKPMEFIQEEVLKAKEALLANDAKEQAMQAEKENAGKEPKKIEYQSVKRSDFVIKSREDIANALGKDSITCCICGRKMKSLGAHLRRVHNVDPAEYIKVCGYPENTSLMTDTLFAKARANMKAAMNARLTKQGSSKADVD